MEVSDDAIWCHKLEADEPDLTAGKVRCVCAAARLATFVLAETGTATQQDLAAIDLLRSWVDDPTDQRFERICTLIFGDENSTQAELDDAVWWALRTATSAVGCAEASWALNAIFESAVARGFTSEQLRRLVEREVLKREEQD